MPGKMTERRIAKLEEQAQERQARGAEDRAWLQETLRLIKARRLAALTDEEREAAEAERQAREAAFAALPPEAREARLATIREWAEEQRARLARDQALIGTRHEPEVPTPLALPPPPVGFKPLT